MNVDKTNFFPNQATDGDPTECVAITVCDLLGNKYGIPFDPDYTYAQTLLLEGVEPTTAGSDYTLGMQTAVAYGALPMNEATFTALSMGELYAANWRNYTAAQKRDALQYVQNGIKSLWSSTPFEDVLGYISKYGTGVSLPISWFSSFNLPQGGVLPQPSGGVSGHNVAAYGSTEINGETYLIIKPWLGPEYGDHGYGYLSKELFLTVVKDALIFNPDARRFVSLVGIMVSQHKYDFVLPYVGDLLKLDSGTTMQTPNGMKLYLMGKSLLHQRIIANNAADDFGVLGCAETINELARRAWGHPIGGGLSTAAMWECLKDTSKFTNVLPAYATAGDIIISPTGSHPRAVLQHGHVGLVAQFGILSNSSETGTLEENYNIKSWVNYYTNYGGLPTFVYRPV